jgi:hypothetical protein
MSRAASTNKSERSFRGGHKNTLRDDEENNCSGLCYRGCYRSNLSIGNSAIKHAQVQSVRAIAMLPHYSR